MYTKHTLKDSSIKEEEENRKKLFKNENNWLLFVLYFIKIKLNTYINT